MDVRFDDKIKIPGATESSVRTRIEEYIKSNHRMVGFVDQIVIHAEIGGKNVDMVFDIK